MMGHPFVQSFVYEKDKKVPFISGIILSPSPEIIYGGLRGLAPSFVYEKDKKAKLELSALRFYHTPKLVISRGARGA
jgi:hypothetical protein